MFMFRFKVYVRFMFKFRLCSGLRLGERFMFKCM